MPSDDRGATPGPRYLRTATSPRMLGLLAVLLVAAAVCGRLGVWQLDRAQLRGEQNARTQAQEALGAEPTPLADLLAPQSGFAGELVGRRVVVSGTFEPSGQLLVPDRSHQGRTGLLVLTPLRVAGPEGAVLPVVRGWVPDADAPATAPSGTVSVVAYLQAGEGGGDPLPEGQVQAISPGELVNRWGGPIYSAYLVLDEVTPPQGPPLETLAPPSLPDADLDVRNLAYALQWWLFGGFAVLLWLRMVRDAAMDELAPADADGVSPSPSGADAAP